METPQGNRTGAPKPQPSPQKAAQMTQGYNASSEDHKTAFRLVNQSLIDILSDEEEPYEARLAAAYGLSVTLETCKERQQFDFDLVTPGQPANKHQAFQQQLNQTLNVDAFQPPQQGPTVSNTPWLDALRADDGKEQGDGSDVEHPYYAGATTLVSEPDYILIDMDLSPTVTKERVLQVQVELFRALKDHRFEGSLNKRKLWMALHPWAALNWVNFYTGLLFGPGTPSRINTILKAADGTTRDAPTIQDAARARALAQKGELTQMERKFYGTMSAVISAQLSTNNAFAKFTTFHEYAALGGLFKQMVDQIEKEPAGELAQSLDNQGRPGVNDKTKLGEACAFNIGLDKKVFFDLVERHNVLTECAIAFTDGFILFVTDQMVTLYRNNVRGAIKDYNAIVKRIFPELEGICRVAKEAICDDILSLDPARNARLRGKKMDTSSGPATLVARLAALRQN